MTEKSLRTIDPRWMASRLKLQERYSDLARLPDASRLAYLRGQAHTVTEEQIAEQWALAAADASDERAANNLYIHVPFCKSICSFCNYERLRPSNPDLLTAYMDRLEGSMSVLGPAVSGMRWGAVYVGGGTPSTLPAKMLDRLFGLLSEHFDIAPDAEKSFEFDPQVMSQARVKVLKEHGFAHFSFGIQALDAEVNEAHNRGPQSRETVTKRFEELYSAGLHDVACDFLLGLAGTTPQQILADIEWVLERHTPRWVDVFQISPTPEYVDRHFSGDIDSFWTHLGPFQAEAPGALKQIAERHGYAMRPGGGHRFTLERSFIPEGWPPLPRRSHGYNQLVSEAQRPLNLLGLGPSARSQIFGHAAFQCRDPGETPLGPGPAVYRGHRINLQDEVRSYLVHQLRDRNEVNRARFQAIFGQSIEEAVPVALSAWNQAGLLSQDSSVLRLKAQSGAERTQALLWLVPDENLEHEISRRQQLDLSVDGVLRLAAELEVGTVLHGRHTFAGVSDGKVLIHTPERVRMSFRPAPGLSEGAGLRLVLESRPPESAEARTALIRAMVQVRGVLRAAAQRR
jgi:coproporphyrinogen III oxidase-like Fe-S oxidoreductase